MAHAIKSKKSSDMKLDLQRTNIYLSAKQLKRLQQEAQKKNTSVAELVRRIIDAHFSSQEKNRVA
jgi:hypothetical protein